jgi:hypothetical protein
MAGPIQACSVHRFDYAQDRFGARKSKVRPVLVQCNALVLVLVPSERAPFPKGPRRVAPNRAIGARS